MAPRRILATSGGYVRGPIQGTIRVGEMLTEALTLTGKTRPRVCVVLTATGDDAGYYAMTYEALNFAGCDVTELKLFTQPSADPTERLCSSDLVWVGGGSVANLLTLWRLHGVDEAMAAAWEAGVILSGVSAGSLCWHVGGTTDSFGPTLRPVFDGLGFLPYANGVHFDSEAQRRPMLHQLVASGELPEVAYATDDTVGVWYEGTEATRVVTDEPVDPENGPAAYRISRVGDTSTEVRLPPGQIAPL